MTLALRLPTLALVATLAAGLAASWQAVGQTTLKINIALAQNSHYGVAIDTFAREVERRTSGRYKVQTFYSAALGAERRSPGIEEMPIGNPFDTSSADLDPGFGTGADSYRADQPGNQDYPDSGYAESSYAASDGESEHGTEYGKDEQPAGYDEAAGYAEDGAYAEDGQYDEDAVYDEDADYDEGEGAGYDEGDEGHQAPAAQEDDEFGWPEFDEPADGDAEPSGGAANSAGAPAGRDGDSRDGRRPRKAAAGY